MKHELCKNGHPLNDPDNVYVCLQKGGKYLLRKCKLCKREYDILHYRNANTTQQRRNAVSESRIIQTLPHASEWIGSCGAIIDE